MGQIPTIAALLAVIFAASLLQSADSATVEAHYTRPHETVNFTIKSTLKLSCTVSDETLLISWRKDGIEVDDDGKRISLYNKGKKFSLSIDKAEEKDAGLYSCFIHDGTAASIRVIADINVKLPSMVNVVEGEKLRLLCNAIGVPKPEISWVFTNTSTTLNINETSGRYILERDPEKKVENAVLKIEVAEKYDRGFFRCIGTFEEDEVSFETEVRIKDKFAALWPFLGICAEVFVLCAIIFIYEKKRNKTELEESDTDQSPDQKNTPDHGKEANLRHRQ